MSQEDRLIKRLILKDGTIFDGSTCGYTEDDVWCFLLDIDFTQAFYYFSNPENYEEISMDVGIRNGLVDRVTYKGLTECTAITKHKNQIDIRLTGSDIQVIETSFIDHEDPEVEEENQEERLDE